MTTEIGITRNEIVNCLREDYESLRTRLRSLRGLLADASAAPDLAASLGELGVSLAASTHAEEEVMLSRALELEEARVAAMAVLEEHELAELMVDRAKHSAHDDQRHARARVLFDLIERHLDHKERELFPLLRAHLSVTEREELGMRYREAKNRNELAPVFEMPVRESLLASQSGRVGYIIAWLLGVPAWVLLLIFLVRGH